MNSALRRLGCIAAIRRGVNLNAESTGIGSGEKAGPLWGGPTRRGESSEGGE